MNEEDFRYWQFNKALDDETCKRILDLGANKFKDAKVNNNLINKDIRDSSVIWMNEQWIYDLVFSYMRSANSNSGWNIDVDAAETMQLTKYKKKGFYGYHKDASGFRAYNKPGNKFLHNKTRKLSMTALLNDEFEGGEFEFYNAPALEMNKGDIVFFPSFEYHRVKPVSKGVRHSLVTWFVGPKYK